MNLITIKIQKSLITFTDTTLCVMIFSTKVKLSVLTFKKITQNLTIKQQRVGFLTLN